MFNETFANAQATRIHAAGTRRRTYDHVLEFTAEPNFVGGVSIRAVLLARTGRTGDDLAPRSMQAICVPERLREAEGYKGGSKAFERPGNETAANLARFLND
jgi:hypothetical protein